MFKENTCELKAEAPDTIMSRMDRIKARMYSAANSASAIMYLLTGKDSERPLVKSPNNFKEDLDRLADAAEFVDARLREIGEFLGTWNG